MRPSTRDAIAAMVATNRQATLQVLRSIFAAGKAVGMTTVDRGILEAIMSEAQTRDEWVHRAALAVWDVMRAVETCLSAGCPPSAVSLMADSAFQTAWPR